MKRCSDAGTASRLYPLISILLVIILLFSSLPPVTSPVFAKTSSTMPADIPASVTGAPLVDDNTDVDIGNKIIPYMIANSKDEITHLIAVNIDDFLSTTLIPKTNNFLNKTYNGYKSAYNLFSYVVFAGRSGFNELRASIQLNQGNAAPDDVLNQAVTGDLDGDGIPDAEDPETIVSESIALSAGEYTFQHLFISDNATLTLNSNTALPGFKGVHIIAENLTIEPGGSINTDGKGYGSAAGPGKGISSGSYMGGSGAGYGGNGGTASNGLAGGTAYGSVTMPTDLGSGGGKGYSGAGGSGGGAVKLDVSGTLTVNGTISANGNAGGTGRWGAGGGGSGGSIYIITDTLSGNGTISACGGIGATGYYGSGGGGGGRIAIYYTSNTYAGITSVYGGIGAQCGGSGTVFTKSAAQAHGDLLLDNSGNAGIVTPITGDNEFDNVSIRNQAHLLLPTGSTLHIPSLTLQTSSLTLATGAILDIPSLTLQSSSFTIGSGVTFNPSHISVQSSTITNNGTISWETIDFQGGTLTNNGLVSAPELTLTNITFVNSGTLDISDNSVTIGAAGILEQNPDTTLANLTILSGGVLSHTAGDNLNLTVSNLTIEPGGSINVDGKGYGPASGPGKGISSGSYMGGSGAGYGGNGGAASNGLAGGTAYGSLTMPTDLGSGGGNGYSGAGGAGGGAIKLYVSGTLTVNGTISANGKNGGTGRWGAGGGGSGGSIYIITDTLSGNGTISACGGIGATGYYGSGGGGGGRIAIYYTSNTYAGITSVYGGIGAQCGGSGTVFTKSAAQAHGELLLDNNGNAGAITTLTGTNEFDNLTIGNKANFSLLTGSTLNTPSITLQSSSFTVGSGVTFNISNISVQSSTITNSGNLSWTTIDFQGGTIINNGVVSAPELMLTNITLRNNGSLNIPGNSITIGNAGILEQNSDITLTNLTVLSGGVMNCAAGDNINLTIPHDLTVEAGGSINVDGKGYGPAAGPGAGGSGDGGFNVGSGGGGGYGGNGGAGTRAGGTAYGSLTMPTDLGSGGGNGYGGIGGAGGGAVQLDVSGTLTVNGTISANGNNGTGTTNFGGGGGSGGSIYITTTILAGNGTISACGGSGAMILNPGGGGAGGRIAIGRNSGSEFTGAIVVSGGTGYNQGEDGTIYLSSFITITEQTYSQSNLTETLLEQTLATDNVTVTGDISGTFAFTDFKMVSVQTGAFANNGFFTAEWQANLENTEYTGSWQGMFFLKQDENRIYLKGNASGGISAIVDGYLTESVTGSGTYDQLEIDLQLSQVGARAISGTVSLNGTVTYQASQQYPSTQLYVLQTSLAGTSSGDYNGYLDIVLTHLRVADNNNPYYGRGFSVIFYTTENSSGIGYAFNSTITPGQIALNGMFNSPLQGIVTGRLNESTSPRTLSITIKRIDLGVPPMADLSVVTWGPAWVDSGATVDYMIEYRNDGLRPAENVVVVDILNPAVEYVSSTGDGIYWPALRQVFWKLGTLAPGAKGYLSIRVKYQWGLYRLKKHYNTVFIDTTSVEVDRYLFPEIPPAFDISKYLEYRTVIAGSLFTPAEFETEMLSDPSVSNLYNYFIEQGYIFSGLSMNLTLSDNTSIKAAILESSTSDNASINQHVVFLIQPENNSPFYFDLGDNTAALGDLDSEGLIFDYNYDPNGNNYFESQVKISITPPPTLSDNSTLHSNSAGNSAQDTLFSLGQLIEPKAVFARTCGVADCIAWQMTKRGPGYLISFGVSLIPYLRSAKDLITCILNASKCIASYYDEDPSYDIKACHAFDHDCAGATASIAADVAIDTAKDVPGLDVAIAVIQVATDACFDFRNIKKECETNTDYMSWENGKVRTLCSTSSIGYESNMNYVYNDKDIMAGYNPRSGEPDRIVCTIYTHHWNTYLCRWILDGFHYCNPDSCVQLDDWNAQCNPGIKCNLLINGVRVASQIETGIDPNAKYGPEGIVYPGEKLDYKVEYENIGKGRAFGVYFTDTLDANLDAATLQISPVIDPATGQNIAEPGIYNPNTRTVKWYVGEVASMQGGYAELSANVNSDVPDGTTIINYATVYFPSVPEATRTNGIVSTVMRDEPRIKVEPTTDFFTTEDGGENIFTVVLQTQPTADVTINLSSDDPSEGTVSPASLTFTPDNWNQQQIVTVTGVADNTPDGDVTYHIITAPAISTDPKYSGLNAADVTVVNIDVAPADQTPPTTQIEVTPSANENGWNNSDNITVDLTAADNEGGSGIKEIHYKLTGTTEDEQTVAASGVSLTIYTEGITTLTYYAVDNTGNQEAEQSITLKLDKTAPTVAASVSSEPNANGWNNTDVTVTFSASDELSGIGAVTEPVTLTTEGAGQNVSGEATDLAGNKAIASATVNIDKTPPIITAVTSPDPNIYGWNNADVTVTFSASDTLSGVKSVTEPVTVTAEGAEQDIFGEAIDYAGNIATTSVQVNIDRTAPVVSVTADPNTLWPPNKKMVDVTISGSATDNTSGIGSTTFTVIDEYATISPTLSGFNTTIQLQAWREGNDKDGRVYTILVTAKDMANNEATSSTKVICPHDQGK
jgi:uncharacterized repeat protein (TIGR01451 family)